MLEKTESPLDNKEIKPANLKGNPPWIFVGKTDAEAEVLVFWSSDVNSQLIGKVPDAGKDWGQKEKRVSEDEMTGWQSPMNGHEIGQFWGDGEGQRGLACCSPWGHKESDTTGYWTTTTQAICFLYIISIISTSCLLNNPVKLCDLGKATKHLWVSVSSFKMWVIYPHKSAFYMTPHGLS